MSTCRTLLPVLLALSISCGGRSLPAADGGLDGAGRHDSLTRDSALQDGGCVRPPGGCFGPQDCPDGQDCMGCLPDPCCPMCAVCYGKCVPSGGCWANKDCGADELCTFADDDCGKTKPGTCTKVPAYCPDGYSPSCGCDGKTYPSPCDANLAGVSVARAGLCDTAQCQGINKAYVAALPGAKQCCAACDSIQCTTKVHADLACGCWTYVNDASTLKGLQGQWDELGCGFGIWNCLGVSCPTVSPGICSPSSTGGICQDAPP